MKFIKAIYDKSVYQEALSEKFSKPLLCWIGISLVSILIIDIAIGLFIYKSLPSLEEIKQEIPNFEIKDGVLDIEQKAELYIEDSPMLIVVDDEYTFDEEDFKYTPQYLVATREYIYIKGEEGDLSEISYNEFEWLKNTNRDTLINNIKDIIPKEAIFGIILAVLVFLFFITFFALIVKFIPILLWALVGLITAKIFNKNLTYENSLKIMIYGNILPTILSTIYWVAFRRDFNLALAFLLVSIYTGYFISRLNTEQAKEEVLNTADTNSIPQVNTINPQQVSTPQIQEPSQVETSNNIPPATGIVENNNTKTNNTTSGN